MPYSAKWKGPIEGWVVNYLVKNFWRVERTQQRDDMLQEAYLVFRKVESAYPDITEDKHFMALFQRSWKNKFTDFANADTADRVNYGLQEVSPGGEGYGDSQEREFIGDCDHDGGLAVMLRQAPSEVTMVINLFLNAPQEILDLALTSWRDTARNGSGGNSKICRMLGLPEELDVVRMVEDYFRPN